MHHPFVVLGFRVKLCMLDMLSKLAFAMLLLPGLRVDARRRLAREWSATRRRVARWTFLFAKRCRFKNKQHLDYLQTCVSSENQTCTLYTFGLIFEFTPWLLTTCNSWIKWERNMQNSTIRCGLHGLHGLCLLRLLARHRKRECKPRERLCVFTLICQTVQWTQVGWTDAEQLKTNCSNTRMRMNTNNKLDDNSGT